MAGYAYCPYLPYPSNCKPPWKPRSTTTHEQAVEGDGRVGARVRKKGMARSITGGSGRRDTCIPAKPRLIQKASLRRSPPPDPPGSPLRFTPFGCLLRVFQVVSSLTTHQTGRVYIDRSASSRLGQRPSRQIMYRRSHKKSRKGCAECKRRHMKVSSL
ncbi:hypothetical protein CDEST_13920 [Colletotrichum destructivum]|uniref:Uncharacterized protein n=1 Tax=Colletotrichum destructivum TaxID=34406 RepID=A0AAX4J0D3_9PEZI|nr:hypothetical protein CDEST_13920 [Colletotrichum destructivum]